MPAMTDRPIRVSLEPGYDFGRFGAWVLDLPGCATWRDDRAATLASVPAAVASFGAWDDTKAEAVSAISQCQAAIAGALRQVKAADGGAMITGWGDAGLSAVAGVLAKAARLIQAKG